MNEASPGNIWRSKGAGPRPGQQRQRRRHCAGTSLGMTGTRFLLQFCSSSGGAVSATGWRRRASAVARASRRSSSDLSVAPGLQPVSCRRFDGDQDSGRVGMRSHGVGYRPGHGRGRLQDVCARGRTEGAPERRDSAASTSFWTTASPKARSQPKSRDDARRPQWRRRRSRHSRSDDLDRRGHRRERRGQNAGLRSCSKPCRRRTYFASNTSSLCITELAAATRGPIGSADCTSSILCRS